MSTVFSVIGVALTAAVFSIFLKSGKMPVFAMLVTLTAGVLILGILLPQISAVTDVFRQLAAKSDLNWEYLMVVLKIVAVCYLAEFMGQICRDSGEGGLAMKIDLGAKVAVMVMAVPIVVSVLDSVLSIMP